MTMIINIGIINQTKTNYQNEIEFFERKMSKTKRTKIKCNIVSII